MTEPKLDREFVEETLSKKADELEEQVLKSTKCPFKDFGELGDMLNDMFSSLSMTATLALYCLENDLGRDFYERANAYLHSGSEGD